jgi:Calcineurin-like phosphoesterase
MPRLRPFRRKYERTAFNSLGIESSCLALLLTVASSQADGQVVRDWKRFPAVAQVPAVKQLYALGDVHGDYDRLVQLLAATHLITPNPATPVTARWTGGTDVLVCTGDMIDKYDHGLSVIALLRALQIRATEAGGQVIITMGNHEADFLADSGGDKNGAEFETELESAGIAPRDVAAGKDSEGVGRWLRDLPIAAKVGDWFFCHAGNTGGLTIAQLEQQIESQVSHRGFACPILADDNSLIQARMHPRPWWDWDGQAPAIRDQANDPPAQTGVDAGQSRLRAGIEALGTHHLVFGHQPGEIEFSDGTERAAGEMYQKFNGLVFLIDTGMSRGVAGGRGALLHITDDSVHGATAVYADGTTRTLVK